MRIFFVATITSPTSTTNEHPFRQRDWILHQSRSFGSTPQSVRTTGLEIFILLTCNPEGLSEKYSLIL